MEGSHSENFGHGNYELEVPGQQPPTPFGNDSNFSFNSQDLDELQIMGEMSSELVNVEGLVDGALDVEANETSLDMKQNDVMMVNLESLSLEDSFSLPTLPSQRSKNEVWADSESTQYSANNPNINDITYFCQGLNIPVDPMFDPMFDDYLVKEGIIQAEDLDALRKEENRCINGCEKCPPNETGIDLATVGDLMLGVKFPHSGINIPAHYPFYLPPPRSEFYIPTRAPMFQAIPPRGSFMAGPTFDLNGIGESLKLSAIPPRGSFMAGPMFDLNGVGESLKMSEKNGGSELVAEQRVRRTIKSRESAARSLARKQGSTPESENGQLMHNLPEEKKTRE